ncbi:MAG: complex I NDUFA9 subunit family protein [Pseudomonadota bacterium]|nr:MAG: complex I NDUFA9 subunit family protein [Pseudomonadota bacterium]
MLQRNICVLGGTGFVGTHVVSRFAAAGHRVRVLTRRRERHRELLVLPTVEVVGANVHDPAVLNEQFTGQDAVVNLVGILNEKGDKGEGFRKAHVELTQNAVHACQKQGVKRILHMSALHADATQGASHYLRTKGEAEDLVHAAGDVMHVTSFRPSVIFGAGDSFFNRFAGLLRSAPGVFPVACGNAKFAPVFVEDIAHIFAAGLDNPHTYGERYDLCGPHTYTLKQLVEYTAELIGKRRKVIALGKGLSLLQANLLEHAPGKPFSRDNYRSLQTDSVCSGPFPEVFGIEPTPLEAEVPKYIAQRRYRARFDTFRGNAGRS